MWLIVQICCFITIMTIPLIVPGIYQGYSDYFSANKKSSPFADHLYIIQDKEAIEKLESFLCNLFQDFVSKYSIILYMSVDALALINLTLLLNSLHMKSLIQFIILDKAQYISANSYSFCSKFYANSRMLIRYFWKQCLLVFPYKIMTKVLMYYTCLMFHPRNL